MVSCFVAVMLSAQTAVPAPDSDQDGISDALEQSLLDRFRPVFLVSATDCAQLPAQFSPGSETPTVTARNGTLYGQVFPASTPGMVEIHYYTLWDRDCGRNGHALDAEHVSAVLAPAAQKAIDQANVAYWYAGAHEDTLCETSNAARASVIAAEERGPRIWISSGKHALYLNKDLCGRGCGGDRCDDNIEFQVAGQVINLGEPGHPMNGSEWLRSQRWPLVQKMTTDFPAETIAILEKGPAEVMSLAPKERRTARAIVLGGDSSLDGLATGARHTGNALGTADTKASQSMEKATHATGASVGRAFKAAFRWVKGPRSQQATKD